MNMLFNGVELAALPKDAQYDNALIFYALNDTLTLICTDSELSLQKTEPLTFDSQSRYWTTYSVDESGEWEESDSQYTSCEYFVVHNILWANYDVLDPDGNVYLAASEPLTLFVITHTVNADLLQRGVRPRVDMVQGDTLTRRLEFVLTAGGVPWTPPEDTTAALSYIRPDGVGRVYDKLPDGTEAYTISENRILFTLHPEMLKVAGDVVTVLRILRESDGKLLSTFAVEIAVEAEPSYSGQSDGDNSSYGAPTSVTAVKTDSAVTVTAVYVGGKTSTATIALDENGDPVSVTKDGETTDLYWEGFDE